MSAPAARTVSGARPFTVAWVPIGMKAGVATGPWGVAIWPQRAAPSVAIRRKEKAVMGSRARGRRMSYTDPGSRHAWAAQQRVGARGAREVGYGYPLGRTGPD